ncbi:MAG: histidine phosphatase family protein [Pseudomonadota bacterium]
MKRLILLRHAKTEPWYEGGDDHGRALTEHGQDDADLMAQTLVDRGWRPDLALVSTARRARETWLRAREAMARSDVRYEDDLYLADPDTLMNVLESARDLSTVMVIAHNPGLHDFATKLARTGPTPNQAAFASLIEKMPTCAAALFEADEDGPVYVSAFRLVDFIRPKSLGL